MGVVCKCHLTTTLASIYSLVRSRIVCMLNGYIVHIGVVTKYMYPAMVIRREESQVSQDLQRGEAKNTERVKRTKKGMCVTCGLCMTVY